MSLGPDARSLLDAAEGGDDPTPADAARVRRKLAAQLALGVAAGATVATVTKTATGAASAGATGAATAGAVPMTSLFGAKVLLALVLVGGAAATGAVAMRADKAPVARVAPVGSGVASSGFERSPARAVGPGETLAAASATPGATTIARAGPAATSESEEVGAVRPEPAAGANSALSMNPVPSTSSTTAAASRPEAATGSSAMNAGGKGRDATGGSAASAAKGAPNNGGANETTSAGAKAGSGLATASANGASTTPPTRDTVAEEAALLRSANAALASGNGPAALARLDEHAARFPHGALTEERQGARVLALCASGRDSEARSAASAFIAASPRSPLVAQVRGACASTP